MEGEIPCSIPLKQTHLSYTSILSFPITMAKLLLIVSNSACSTPFYAAQQQHRIKTMPL